MHRLKTARLACPIWVCLMVCATTASAAGLVVEHVEAGFAAEQAGLRPGDLLLRWERAASPPVNPGPAAQLAVLRRAATSHPSHWAAFQLIGDWK